MIILIFCIGYAGGCKSTSVVESESKGVQESSKGVNLKLLAIELLGEDATFEIAQDPTLILLKNTSLASGGMFFLVYDQDSAKVIYDGTAGVVSSVSWVDEEKLLIQPARRTAPEDSKPNKYYLDPRTGQTEVIKIGY